MNFRTARTPLILITLVITIAIVACFRKEVTIPPPPPPPVATTLKQGLLLYLPFNGSIADSSGNNNPDTAYNGAALTTDQNGKPNSAFGNNGTSAVIVVTNNGSIQFDTTLSVSLNFMVNTTYGRNTFLSMVNPVNAYGPTFTEGLIVPNLSNFDAGVDDSTDGCNNTNQYDLANTNDTTGFIPQPNVWYNSVFTYNHGTLSVYINGQLTGTKTLPYGAHVLNVCPDSKIMVGCWWYSDPAYLNGKVDEIRLYNRVLNSDEIAYLSQGF
jgi:Concanavalin A-like lectin/glucanases superfamily